MQMRWPQIGAHRRQTMNAPIPTHVLPTFEPRPVPPAMLAALKKRFGERCSTALAVR
jgi:D-lactate dehydrogenase (cytochrome)